MTRAVFLDRDGVLDALVYYADSAEWESPRAPQDFHLLPGALDALKAIQRAGWLLFLVSNQPSYAKGKTSLEALKAVHAELEKHLIAQSTAFQAVYYCYHHPQGIVPEYSGPCDCRKPGIGSLIKAQVSFGLTFSDCWFIGDQDVDILCGQNAGCRTIQLDYPPSQPKRGSSNPDERCATLAETLAILNLS